MLKFEDTLHSHCFFCRAATAAIKCYVKLDDTPPKTLEAEEEIAAVGLFQLNASGFDQKCGKQRLKLRERRRKKVRRDVN
ncbi:hypothetical protein MPTK1_2g18720 [Marchantia polymorpha subsp. ruderalis]|uniref:Uncharacterized protein n=1 Tax=Marchantia polymorpha TaxID=3197 RepID=A0A2R6W734_MARPO|nr:hypothetical protein MARPO_0137s0010 [Marchantia polymorpha]BBN02854.1 hypothetical protein Mp_2g18720 [Marchantia polymorpha subsp. ruderalis]|eukprot:PTQ29642.1 hypothetical protein MARPO_0137s0010 [Marchantia polymorpha]